MTSRRLLRGWMPCQGSDNDDVQAKDSDDRKPDRWKGEEEME